MLTIFIMRNVCVTATTTMHGRVLSELVLRWYGVATLHTAVAVVAAVERHVSLENLPLTERCGTIRTMNTFMHTSLIDSDCV